VRRQVGQSSQQGNKLCLPWRRRRDAAPQVVPDAAHDAAALGLARQRALDVQGAIAAYEVRTHASTDVCYRLLRMRRCALKHHHCSIPTSAQGCW